MVCSEYEDTKRAPSATCTILVMLPSLAPKEAFQPVIAPQLAGAYPMMIGVPQYAVYLSHRYYDPTISGDKAAALAEYLISETASQDPKVGGPIKIAKISPEHGYQQLSDAEV